jgi:uncharacterized membrane protein YhaH (DUF805 family)
MPDITFLWRFDGVGRLTYVLAGVALFAIKFLIDWSLARFVFGRDWSLIEYLAPGQTIGSLLSDVPDRRFYLAMAAAALPFIAAGLSLTVRRLRDAGLPRWLLVLFFVPFANLLFFAAMSLLPSRERLTPSPATPPASDPPLAPVSGAAVPLDYGQDPAMFTSWYSARWWPRSDGASGLLAGLAPVPFVVGLVFFGTHLLREYGWGLFIGLPFVNGMLAAVLHGIRVPRTLGQCMRVSLPAIMMSGLTTILFAIEGLGCLIMFLPLALPIGMLGACLGYAIQARPMPPGARAGQTWHVGCCVALLLPALMSAERAADAPAPMLVVKTVVEVDAPADVVWRHVVTFSEIPPPHQWLFKTGVAYPVRARIDGSGVGAIRYCEFSTGAFVEPIEIWDEPRLLQFAVTSNPPPMKEWSPWPGVHPPHIDGFLVASAGQFELVQLPGGRTRLEGTTWYRHNMWPAAYWRLWSDFIIHRIHGRVLNHVKTLSEDEGRGHYRSGDVSGSSSR